MARRKILVDGYNMGMASGTGIATYARGLVAAARAAGCEVETLVAAAPRLADPRAHRIAEAIADFGAWRPIVVGALIIAVLLVYPGGLAAGVGAAARKARDLFGRAPVINTKTTS